MDEWMGRLDTILFRIIWPRGSACIYGCYSFRCSGHHYGIDRRDEMVALCLFIMHKEIKSWEGRLERRFVVFQYAALWHFFLFLCHSRRPMQVQPDILVRNSGKVSVWSFPSGTSHLELPTLQIVGHNPQNQLPHWTPVA